MKRPVRFSWIAFIGPVVASAFAVIGCNPVVSAISVPEADVSVGALSVVYQPQASKARLELLGKMLFFDEGLSEPRGQSCATCHDPSVGFTGPDSAINAATGVYPGADPALFGNRKPPSAAYAGDSGPLHFDAAAGDWVGGMFWDGRADGSILGDPLAEQAKGPFLNPLEMGLDSPEELCLLVAASPYTGLFEEVWGAGSLDPAHAQAVYDRIGISIAAYERSAEVNPYNSKFDQFWDRAKAGRLDVQAVRVGTWSRYRKLGLSDTELYGLAVFNDPSQANCASCHSLKPGSAGYPLFTDYTYVNLGVPKNPDNPFYDNTAYNPDGANWIDYGLGGFLGSSPENGMMKVPTLRNVDKRPSSTVVKAYGHNGYFKSLSEIVMFYAWRGMRGGMGGGGMGGGGMGGGGMGGGGMGGGGMGGGGMGGGGMGGMMFPPPEVNENLAPLNAFSHRDQSSIVAFLKTLSDGYFRR